ncbi:MAG: STAS domain-containing protein [Anaerolineae bacterium]|uniref:STAS domain-containing protein n=1 Tax=Promineifilum sp. TaxID=2664178 RepID=UPI001D6735B6|nr:STAS domain-containing protein [Anaerolineales bacterium]MCB8936549.1 STAS domain-containing protein [Promineifilum sp.]MCO5178723.1 STAS domain-containing protein [Promineifilum sp.]MCW5846932.1 STAS domain-containing protein [Anaerolineae bacterium]
MSVWQEKLPQSDVWLVGVDGRLDQTLNPKLEEVLNELLDNDHFNLLVDLSRTTYINSGGLRCLVSAWRRAKANEGSLALCGLNSRLQEIFSMVGFDKVFEIYEDCSQARSRAKPQTRS